MSELELWNLEHKNPKLFPQLDSQLPSGGIKKLYQWLLNQKIDITAFNGLEIGCGKGRNTNWLSRKGIMMSGFDFSEEAISVAKFRANKISNPPYFSVANINKSWPYEDNSFDLVIDCFSLIEITSNVDHVFLEVNRVLKSGGYFFSYTNGDQSEVYKKFKLSNHELTYQYPDSGKIEMVFSKELFAKNLVNFTNVIFKTRYRTNFYNEEEYVWHHLWLVYKKN